MHKLLSALSMTVLALALTVQAAPAAAGEIEWCAGDPLITVDGTVYSVTTLMQTNALNVAGITYVVSVPEQAVVSVDTSGDPFHPTVIVQRTGASRIIGVRATVTSTEQFAVAVTITGGGETATTLGASNRTVRVSLGER